MKFHMKWLVPLLAAAALFAQQKKRAEPPPAVFPLQSLRVEGNQKLTVEKILSVAALKIGEPVIRTDFDQARRRLMATGAFQSVAYEFRPSMDAKGVDGLLRVIEVDYWFPYRFEDLPASDSALRAMLRKQELILGDQIPATKEVITRYTAAIEEFLGGKVEVTGKVISDVPGHPTIVFRPPPRARISPRSISPATMCCRPRRWSTRSRPPRSACPIATPLYRSCSTPACGLCMRSAAASA